ncbi:26481_t:CDS:2, partial [Gigaspora margarita]
FTGYKSTSGKRAYGVYTLRDVNQYWASMCFLRLRRVESAPENVLLKWIEHLMETPCERIMEALGEHIMEAIGKHVWKHQMNMYEGTGQTCMKAPGECV